MDCHLRRLLAPRVRVAVQAATGALQALLEVWKTLAEDHELQTLFPGLSGQGAPGLWGTKPANPQWWLTLPTFCARWPRRRLPPSGSGATRGYPAPLGLAVYDHAQLQRYTKDAFGSEVNICVHRCT